MASLNPPPEWLKEWATVGAKLAATVAHIAAVVFVLFRIIRAVAG
jgi:hypothetical protein